MNTEAGTRIADATCGTEKTLPDPDPRNPTSDAQRVGWSARIADLSRPEVEVEVAGVLGMHIHDLRTSRRMTMHALAKNTGCSQTMICRLEKGSALPSLYTLIRLAWALGVPPASMLAPMDELRRRLEVPVGASGRIRLGEPSTS